MLRIRELGNKSLVERTTDDDSDKEALRAVITSALVQVRDKEKDVLVLFESEEVQYNGCTDLELDDVPKYIQVPSGLLSWLGDEIEHLGYEYQMESLPRLPKADVSDDLLSDGPVPITLRDYQVLSLKKGLTHRRGIFNIGTGGGKTEIIIGLAKMLGSSLTIVPGKGVLKQCYRRFKDRGIEDVGRLGAGYNVFTAEHTIATASVINSRLNKGCPKVRALLDRVKVLMFDEVHHLGTAPSWQNVANNCGAERRYGFSGSPWASGKPDVDLANYKDSKFADFRVASQVGDTLVYIPSKMLREMGVIVDPDIYVVGVNQPKGLTRNPFPRWRWVYNRGIIENDHRNYLIAEAAHRFHKRDHRTVILVVSIPHGKDLLKRLHAYGLNAAFTKGSDEVLVYTGKKIKKHGDAGEKYRDAFLAGEIDVLIGSVVIDEAVDLPEMSALILAGGMKSPIRAVQRIGRAIRNAEGKDEAVVLDFRDRQHYFLNNHTNVRLGIYDAHEYDYEEVEWAELWEKLDGKD